MELEEKAKLFCFNVEIVDPKDNVPWVRSDVFIRALIKFHQQMMKEFINNLDQEGYSFLCKEHGYNNCDCGDNDETSCNIIKVLKDG